MITWNLAFDYSACFLLLLIFVWYFNEKRIPLKSHKAFLCLVTDAFCAAGLEIAATQMGRMDDIFSKTAFDITLNAQTLAINFVPLFFTYYVLLLAHVDVKSDIKLRLMFQVAFIVDFLIVVINYFTDFAYTFVDGRYVTGTGCIIMYGIDAVAVAVCVYNVIKHSKNFMFVRSAAMTFNIICAVVAAVLQILYYIPVINFMLASVCLTLYYYLQNPGTVTDPVTRLFNRKFMGEYIMNNFKVGKSFGIVSIAMDDFKFINKTYGVENGDNLLLQVGNFLDGLKASKTVFRFGSDQFCVVINKNVEDMEKVAHMIEARFKHPWYSDTQLGIMMSASICCIECPKDAGDYGSLIEVMDYSMSIAKKTRKGKVTMTRDMDLSRITEDKAVEKAVKQAMDRDELMVYYQPIFSVSKGVYNSAEALVRLHDEELGWISPEVFIPIAEKNGLIIEMGETILRSVCRFIRDFKISETTVEYIEVNISPVQLMQINFADRVKAILEEYGVRPGQINMEITETATISSTQIVNDNIGKLVEYGITFSLDDYGSGHANIDYINHMPFKIIKLDKYIIWDAFKNDKAGITLEYTIGMLNALELYIVAEGVETEEMKNHLVNIGCHYMQGWYYSKAICDTEFMKLINA